MSDEKVGSESQFAAKSVDPIGLGVPLKSVDFDDVIPGQSRVVAGGGVKLTFYAGVGVKYERRATDNQVGSCRFVPLGKVKYFELA